MSAQFVTYKTHQAKLRRCGIVDYVRRWHRRYIDAPVGSRLYHALYMRLYRAENLKSQREYHKMKMREWRKKNA